MKTRIAPFLTALVAAGLLAATPPAAAASCRDAAKQAENQTGGKTISVNAEQRGGSTVCVITLSVPGKNNQPPRLVTREVKQ